MFFSKKPQTWELEKEPCTYYKTKKIGNNDFNNVYNDTYYKVD